VRLIEGDGSAEGGGLKAVCANCKDDFDDRGGILFDGLGRAGLCPECSNEVVQLVNDPDAKEGE
jgi:hypothetical protein